METTTSQPLYRQPAARKQSKTKQEVNIEVYQSMAAS